MSNEEQDLGFLLDTSYPLLQAFRKKCPGSYKHAQSLVSMVESISFELGLNINFMKVCALYHDIGKMFNPLYFSENQIEGENPHDNLDPWVSYQIISRHVPDTVTTLLANEDFSRDIINIISQHHGNGILKFFYDKSGADDPNMFRYRCSKPYHIEGAVLMIADHVEAKSRSYFQAGKFDGALIIESTIADLLDDGLLDEVTMKLGDLKKIKIALAKELEGSYQKRVDYNKVKTDDVEQKND